MAQTYNSLIGTALAVFEEPRMLILISLTGCEYGVATENAEGVRAILHIHNVDNYAVCNMLVNHIRVPVPYRLGNR